MIALYLLAAAAPAPSTGALAAEYSFASDAERSGQWTAFREYAHADAVMFAPQAVWAQQFLRGRADPPHALVWRPSASFVSCDGRTAVNQGPWSNPAGTGGGTFTTVWQADGPHWRWVYDGGEPGSPPAAWPANARVRQAACNAPASGPPLMATPAAVRHSDGSGPDDFGRGESADHSLGWDWKVDPAGTRHFRTFLWTGSAYEVVIDQNVSNK
jgi:hypothetical protein